MKEIMNEYLFYITESVLVLVVSIYLTYKIHYGSFIWVIVYSISISLVVNFISNIIMSIKTKEDDLTEENKIIE